jgi:hypothetical protein
MTTHVTRTAAQRGGTSAAPSSAKRSRAPYRQQLTAAGPGKPAAGGEARRLAAVILEVLAGVCTPASAAQALGIRLPRYYFLEQRAIRGLVAACEPRPKGRTVSSDRQIARLERELAVCRRELGRQQALARAAQRVLGLKLAQQGAVGNGKVTTTGKKTRRRRPVVRALRAARVLQAGVTTNPADGEVQPPDSALPEGDGGNLSPGKEGNPLPESGGQGG